MSQTTTSCFFSGSVSLSCCQLIAFFRLFGPPPVFRKSHKCDHLSLRPSRSVTVCHIEDLRFLSGSSSLSLTWAFAAAPGSQDEICRVLSFPNWAQLNTLLTLRPSACFFYFLEETLWLPQPSIDHFHFRFSLSGVLCRGSPPTVLSLWTLLLIHLLRSWQSSWALVMVVLQVLEPSASHSSHPQLQEACHFFCLLSWEDSWISSWMGLVSLERLLIPSW